MLCRQEANPDMGRARRPRPKRLAEKLLQIRTRLGLSQDAMARHLGPAEEVDRNYVSKFERGVAEPPLEWLLVYGELAGLYVDAIIDDRRDIPARLPCSPKSEGVRRRR